MKYPAKLLSLICVLACFLTPALAQTNGVNVIYSWANYVQQPANVRRFSLIPIPPTAGMSWGTNILLPPPVSFTVASKPQMTNGWLEVSNVVCGTAYQFNISDYYSTYSFTNYFYPLDYTNGTLNANQRLSFIAGPYIVVLYSPNPTIQTNFVWTYQYFTNIVNTTNVLNAGLAAGSGITFTTNAGVITISSTGSGSGFPITSNGVTYSIDASGGFAQTNVNTAHWIIGADAHFTFADTNGNTLKFQTNGVLSLNGSAVQTTNGNGSGLTNLTGANVTGVVPAAVIATSADQLTAANLTINLTNGTPTGGFFTAGTLGLTLNWPTNPPSGALTNVVVNPLNGLTSSVSISGSTATISIGNTNPATSGAVTNAPWQQTAANFIAANPSLNGELQKEINAWCFEYNYGASQPNSGFNWTNLVDKVIIDGRWGTNITTLKGLPIWYNGVTVVPLDGVVSYSSSSGGIAVSNIPDMRPPFTISMTWNQMGLNPSGGSGVFSGGFMAGLFDTNQITGVFLEKNHAPAVFACNGTVSNSTQPYNPGVYNYTTAPFEYNQYWNYTAYESWFIERNNTTITCDTNGVFTAWENGVQSKWGYPSLTTNYVSGVTNYPNPMIVLRILNSYNSVCCASGNSQYTTRGGISGITLLNCVANSNLVKAVWYADQEIIPDTTRRIFIGDSKWAGVDQAAHIGDSAPTLFQISSAHQYERAHWNYAAPSQLLASFVDTNSLYRINNLMAPHGRVTRTEVWNQACSVNQFYSIGGAQTASNVWNQATNYLAICNSNNEVLFMTTCSTMWTNTINLSLTNNSANDLQRVTFNSMLRTNAYLFAGVADNDAVVSQAVVNTNSIPQISNDGVHPDIIPTGYPWNPIVMQWADQMLYPTIPTWNTVPLLGGSTYLVNAGSTNATALTAFTASFTTAFVDTNYTATATGNGFALASSYVSNKTTTNCIFNMSVATGTIDWVATHQ